MICSSESEIERENRMIRLFKAKQVDGIIVAPTKVSKIEIQNLVKEAQCVKVNEIGSRKEDRNQDNRPVPAKRGGRLSFRPPKQ